MFNQQEYINSFIKNNYKTIKIRIRNDDSFASASDKNEIYIMSNLRKKYYLRTMEIRLKHLKDRTNL